MSCGETALPPVAFLRPGRGSAGLGQGGGLYLTPAGSAFADLATAIFANEASTSHDDVFGDLG